MLLPLRYSHITPPHNTLPTNASLQSIRGASDSVDSTHYLLTKEAEVEVGVAITSDSLKDHPAADATFFKIAKSESKLALYDEEAIEDEDPEDFEVDVESSNSNPSQEGEYDEYGDEDEMGLESFHEDVSGDGDEIGALLNTLPSLSQCGDPPPGTIGLGIRFPEGTALDIIASSANLAPDRLKCSLMKLLSKMTGQKPMADQQCFLMQHTELTMMNGLTPFFRQYYQVSRMDVNADSGLIVALNTNFLFGAVTVFI
jgi:hypothetical protein